MEVKRRLAICRACPKFTGLSCGRIGDGPGGLVNTFVAGLIAIDGPCARWFGDTPP